MPGLTSAAGLIGLLDEPEEQLRCYALEKLNQNVDQFWTEIADHVSKMYVCEGLLIDVITAAKTPLLGGAPSTAIHPPGMQSIEYSELLLIEMPL